jgi:hypothetical protein
MMEPYLHYPIRLHGIELKQLSTGITSTFTNLVLNSFQYVKRNISKIIFDSVQLDMRSVLQICRPMTYARGSQAKRPVTALNREK